MPSDSTGSDRKLGGKTAGGAGRGHCEVLVLVFKLVMVRDHYLLCQLTGEMQGWLGRGEFRSLSVHPDVSIKCLTRCRQQPRRQIDHIFCALSVEEDWS